MPQDVRLMKLPKLPLPRVLAGMTVCLLLAGCLGGLQPPSLFNHSNGAGDPALGAQNGAPSATIGDLRSRQAILPPYGSYAEIANAVIQGSTGAANAELRMAQLKQDARNKNWLPSIGPVVSLTSLGTVAAQLVVDQAILDNGRRKAERDFAAADVDVAAVALSADMNNRIYDGLSHYLAAEQAREQAAIAEKAAARLTEFEDIVTARVQGGLSDMSEQQIIAQKRAEMQATLASDGQTARQALDDLAALTGRRMDDLRGTLPLPADAGGPEPLAVAKARAEGSRTLAEARATRASALPGLSAGATLDASGDHSSGLTLGGVNLGLGTPATLRALDATPDLVNRRTAQAAQDANRDITALLGQMAALETRSAQGSEVLRHTTANMELFTEQYRAGRRTLLELVSQYDAAARLERDQAALKYEIARLRLQIARDRGVLVNGAQL